MESTLSQPHHLIDIISRILLFFAISGLVVPLLQRIRISPVLGYLVCGIMIGPYGIAQFSENYAWLSYVSFSDATTVQMLGELGIISLLFMIGLELSFDGLKSLKKYIFGLGTAQIVVTACVVFAIANVFENSIQAAVLLGVSFALSSTAIVMKLLEDQKLSNRPVGMISFSVLLMQDMAVVPILVLASAFTADAHAAVMVTLAESLLVGVVTVVVIYGLGKKVLTPILRLVSFSTTTEWLAALIVFIVLGCAAITHAAGLSLALGAFLAGLLISETEFRHEVEVVISPLKGLLLGIFFLSVGMMVDLAEVLHYPILLLLSVAGIFVLKASIMMVLCWMFRVPGRQSGEVAVYLAQPGEFALMILSVAMASELMPTEDVQFFLLVTVMAMLMTPLMFRLAPSAGNFGHWLLGDKDIVPEDPVLAGKKRVVIAGFGRIGQLVAKVLSEQRVPYIAFDNDGQRVQHLKQQNFQVIYGDAKKNALWRHLIHENIEAAVIAIDDHHSARHILQTLRNEFPGLPVIIRSRDSHELKGLCDAGASSVVAETLESSLRIAQILLEKLGDKPEAVRSVLDKIRAQEG